ncbi:ATP-binding protein [Streptomyces sp. bgisy126]|uniref:ATP-binding protein n=1 Tax=unclassified Streptomyces TaxID=2593676 RepID=UPI003EB76101
MGSDADADGDARPDAGGRLMRAGYRLNGDSACIAEARRHAVAFLDKARTEHGPAISDRVRDLTTLVVSELVTNACKYASGPVLMELCIGMSSVDVVVRDSDPHLPTARKADPGRIGQHGLEIVRTVAEELLVEREPVGKRVTARIALADAPSLT